MRPPGKSRAGFLVSILFAALTVSAPCPLAWGQAVPQGSFGGSGQVPAGADAQAEQALQRGIALAQQGHFEEAIPFFLRARGRVSNEYAASFDLALCYVSTSKFGDAIPILQELGKTQNMKAEVYSLLAQAFLGVGKESEASDAFQKAISLDPKNEKLYLFVADACMESHSYEFGMKVLEEGLRNSPQSPRLHYVKGIFYSFLNEPDKSEDELEMVAKIAPGSVIASLATAQKGLLDGDTAETIRAAREGIRKDPENYILLAILGQALIRNGAGPGQPEFDEAKDALEKSVARNPDYWVSQLALGQVYLMVNRLDDAIAHLESARRRSSSPSVYSQLAIAYRRHGDMAQAKEMLKVLSSLNQQDADRHKVASPDHMASYMGTRAQ